MISVTVICMCDLSIHACSVSELQEVLAGFQVGTAREAL